MDHGSRGYGDTHLLQKYGVDMGLLGRIRGIVSFRGRRPVERRAEARLDVCLDVRLWTEGLPIPCYTRNICASGIKLEIRSPLEFRIGQEFPIEIDLPRSSRKIAAVARVLRVGAPTLPHAAQGIACRLEQIDPDDQQTIRDFVYRREHERLRLDIPDAAPVTLNIWVDQAPLPAFAHDISAGGVRLTISTPHCFHKDECYRMRIHLPGDEHGIPTLARLLRIPQQPDEPGTSGAWQLAFRFVEIEPADQERIDAFVHSNKYGAPDHQ
jgi:c-di-GMP-binding flagellar brake protein YcgR